MPHPDVLLMRAAGQRATATRYVASAISKSSRPTTCSTMLSPVVSQISTRKAKSVLVFLDKSDSTRPGPLFCGVAFPDFCEPCQPSPAADGDAHACRVLGVLFAVAPLQVSALAPMQVSTASASRPSTIIHRSGKVAGSRPRFSQVSR